MKWPHIRDSRDECKTAPEADVGDGAFEVEHHIREPPSDSAEELVDVVEFSIDC